MSETNLFFKFGITLFFITLILGSDINFTFALSTNNNPLTWVWKCDEIKGYCSRQTQSSSDSETLYPSVESCRLICGKYGGLWPRPTITAEMSSALFTFSASSFDLVLPSKEGEVKNFLSNITNLFKESISLSDTSSCPQQANTVKVILTVANDDLTLDWSTHEEYNIDITAEENQCSVNINATTVFGLRHGLETVSQLIEYYENNDESQCLVITTAAKIADKPYYVHRGLLIDTARNFLSIESIKKHIDAMAASKFNVLHWHITDSQSFPLELLNLPNMTKFGAYVSSKIYHPEDIANLLAYAKVRGIRIIIEIDAPAHSGNGWQWGPDAGLGNLAVCVNQQPWRSYCIQPPCGQLNPINPNLYKILKELFNEIASRLPKGEVFHMGGDEVFIACWNSTEEIINYLGNKSRTTETFLDLWSEYQQKALKSYDAAVGLDNTPIILWSSHLTDSDVIEKYLPKSRYVIQTWVPASDELPKDLLKLGYRIIESTKDAWYLDHGFWGTTSFHDWKTVYSNNINTGSGVLGGEVCMWGEYVDDSGTESRVWPRAAAAAERLWSNPSSNVNEAAQRFYRHRERLVARGIGASAVIPRWCYQNEGEC